MPRYVLEVMYDGTKFHGSQVQGDVPTVQLAINNMLNTLFRTTITSFGASRTDEGVHALSNFYHFDLDTPLNFDLLYKGNAILPQGVAIKNIFKAKDDFNARFEATARRYRYRIYAHKNPFLAERAFFWPFSLRYDILNETAAIIKEYTQFESFAKRNSQSATFNCAIMQSRWEHAGDELHYIVEANRFLRGMVRGLVATQLRLAKGAGSADELRKILLAQDCTKAFFNVPGHGLYLEEITYPAGILEQVKVETR